MTIVCLIACQHFFAQNTAGTLYYSKVEYYSTPDLPEEFVIPSDSIFSNFTIDFNPNYSRQTDFVQSQTNVVVRSRTSNKILVALYPNSDNTFKCFQSEEIDPAPEDALITDHYKENFYVDLMNQPLTDTLFISTDETKTISGYLCKKTTVKTPYGDLIQVWTTDALPGLEEFAKASIKVKGTMVMQELMSKGYYSRIQLIKTDFTEKIDTNQLISFPEKDLTFDMGSTYLQDGKFVKMDVMGFQLPDFVQHPDFEKSICQINEIMSKSAEIQNISEVSGIDNELKLIFQVDKKGKISNIFVTNYGVDIEYKVSRTLDELKRKCTFKPITVNNKIVPFKFSFYYNFLY